MISYYTEGVEMPPIQQSEITAWVKAVAGTYDKRVGEIAYIFCSDEKILEVNRLFISLDTIRTNAEQFQAPYETELHRVIIHGILHLCGINDKGPGEREIMEAAENKALDLLTQMRAGTAPTD